MKFQAIFNAEFYGPGCSAAIELYLRRTLVRLIMLLSIRLKPPRHGGIKEHKEFRAASCPYAFMVQKTQNAEECCMPF
jgi:hypothetical protein